MKTKNGSDLVSSLDVVVADGALTILAVVFGFDQTCPIFFDGLAILFECVFSQVG